MYCIFTLWRDSYFDEDLWPVLILFIGGHQQVTSQYRHKTVALGFEVDGSIPA